MLIAPITKIIPAVIFLTGEWRLLRLEPDTALVELTNENIFHRLKFRYFDEWISSSAITARLNGDSAVFMVLRSNYISYM